MLNLTSLYLEASIKPESILSRRNTLNCLLIRPIMGSSPLTLNAISIKAGSNFSIVEITIQTPMLLLLWRLRAPRCVNVNFSRPYRWTDRRLRTQTQLYKHYANLARKQQKVSGVWFGYRDLGSLKCNIWYQKKKKTTRIQDAMALEIPNNYLICEKK